MQVLDILAVTLSVTCCVIAKPYQYSYYISTPGHYQSLAVRDGAVLVNGGPIPQARSNDIGAVNPNIRQGRVRPGFSDNPVLSRGYPMPAPSGFNGNKDYPNQRSGFGGNTPIGRGFPLDRNSPDFRRGLSDPELDIPDGELDPLFNQDRSFPGRSYPQEDTRFNQVYPYSPNEEMPGNYNFRRYNVDNPEFGARIQPRMPRHMGISGRAPKVQEIDETTTDSDKEEVTTQTPCNFCGVNKINPMDAIDDNNTNPDSEPVEPKNVGTNNPNFLVQNNVVNPGGVPAYPYNTPVIPYYVLL